MKISEVLFVTVATLALSLLFSNSIVLAQLVPKKISVQINSTAKSNWAVPYQIDVDSIDTVPYSFYPYYVSELGVPDFSVGPSDAGATFFILPGLSGFPNRLNRATTDGYPLGTSQTHASFLALKEVNNKLQIWLYLVYRFREVPPTNYGDAEYQIRYYQDTASSSIEIGYVQYGYGYNDFFQNDSITSYSVNIQFDTLKNSISGTVKNATFDFGNGQTNYSPLPTNVNLIENSLNLSEITRSDANGDFEFGNLVQGENRIYIDNSAGNHRVNYDNIETGVTGKEFDVPFGLFEQLDSLTVSLLQFKVAANGFFSSIGFNQYLPGYDPTAVANLETNWTTIDDGGSTTDSSVDNVIHSSISLLMAEKSIYESYQDADLSLEETLKTVSQMSALVLSVQKALSFLKETNNILLLKISNYILTLMSESVKGTIDLAMSVAPAGDKVLLESKLNELIDKANITGGAAQDLIAEEGAELILKEYYIQNTQEYLDAAAANSKSYNYSYAMPSVIYSSLLTNFSKDHRLTSVENAESDSLLAASHSAQIITDFSALITSLSAISVIGAEFAAPFGVAADYFESVSLADIVGALHISLSRFLQVKDELRENVSAIYPNVQHSRRSPQALSVLVSKRNIHVGDLKKTLNVVTDYDMVLQEIIKDINSHQKIRVFERIDTLIQQDSLMDINNDLSLYRIFSAIPAIDTSNKYFFSLFDTTSNLITASNMKRARLYFLFTSAMLDSSNSSYFDSIKAQASTIISGEQEITDNVVNLSSQIDTIASPPLVAVTELNIPQSVPNDSNFVAKLYYKNFGNTAAASVDMILGFDSGFSTERDTVLLGELLPDQTDSINLDINSPAYDTTGEYSVYFEVAGGTSIPYTGSVKSTGISHATSVITVDGALSDPRYVTLASKQNSNSGFGPNIDVSKIVCYQDNSNHMLYLGVTGQLDDSTDSAIGIWLNVAGSGSPTGAPAGQPLGGVNNTQAFFSNITNRNFMADFEVDYQFSVNPGNSTTHCYVDAADMVGEPNGTYLGDCGQSGSPATGTLNGQTVRFAFNNQGGPNQGFEMAIPFSAIGASSSTYIQAFAFIVSSNATFSDVTVPGNISTGNPGINPDFANIIGGPFHASSSVSGVLAQSGIPKFYNLYQNFPNPFNPTTTIQFDIKQTSMVTVNIFDILGRKIISDNYGEMEPGTYRRELDLSRYASGVYFFRLRAVDQDGHIFQGTKRMLLLK